MLFSAKVLVICFFVEADQQCFPLTQGRRPQIACRAQKVSEQRFVVGRVFPHIEGDYLFASGDDHSIRASGQVDCLLLPAFLLPGVGKFLHPQVAILKVPLSPLAARSSLAVVKPIDVGRHC